MLNIDSHICVCQVTRIEICICGADAGSYVSEIRKLLFCGVCIVVHALFPVSKPLVSVQNKTIAELETKWPHPQVALSIAL